MNKSGINLELLVDIFEKSLDPLAIIEHDVQMPVITSQIGATRQCDIVITQGKPPRQTITIVEVQDRSRKPSRNDFGGWIDKMKEIGAQHLICVSKVGFTNAQKEKAAQIGNSIRLIELKELDNSKIPFNLKLHFAHCEFKMSDLVFSNLSFSTINDKGEKQPLKDKKKISLKVEGDAPIFTYDKVNYLPMSQLVRDELKEIKDNTRGKEHMKFPTQHDKYLYIPFYNDFLLIEFEMTFNWENIKYDLPITTLSYEQNNFGILGWVAEFIHISENKTISYKMPFEILNDGKYIMKTMSIDEFESGKLVKREILK